MKIANSLARSEVDSLIHEESSKLRITKELVSRRLSIINNKIIREDLGFVAIPKILSTQYCVLFGNTHLLAVSPPLQAFLAYTLSIYDVISNNHLYKNGRLIKNFLKSTI